MTRSRGFVPLPGGRDHALEMPAVSSITVGWRGQPAPSADSRIRPLLTLHPEDVMRVKTSVKAGSAYAIGGS